MFRRWLHSPVLQALAALQAQATSQQRQLIIMEAKLAQIDDDITQLQADVTADTSAVNSAVTLINGFAQQLADAVAAAQAAGASPAQLQALADLHTAIQANSQALAAAVAANTPAPPTP